MLDAIFVGVLVFVGVVAAWAGFRSWRYDGIAIVVIWGKHPR